jgi:hypothetical protein
VIQEIQAPKELQELQELPVPKAQQGPLVLQVQMESTGMMALRDHREPPDHKGHKGHKGTLVLKVLQAQQALQVQTETMGLQDHRGLRELQELQVQTQL